MCKRIGKRGSGIENMSISGLRGLDRLSGDFPTLIEELARSVLHEGKEPVLIATTSLANLGTDATITFLTDDAFYIMIAENVRTLPNEFRKKQLFCIKPNAIITLKATYPDADTPSISIELSNGNAIFLDFDESDSNRKSSFQLHEQYCQSALWAKWIEASPDDIIEN